MMLLLCKVSNCPILKTRHPKLKLFAQVGSTEDSKHWKAWNLGLYLISHVNRIGKTLKLKRHLYPNISISFNRLKALANEDTLLRTHCCSWCFLGRANWDTFVADTKRFWTKSETFSVGKHLCRQQCVRNNVSSFARAFIRASRCLMLRMGFMKLALS